MGDKLRDFYRTLFPKHESPDLNDEMVAFNVHTYPESSNKGLTFSFRAKSVDECNTWIERIQTATAETKKASPKVSFFRRYQVIDALHVEF